MARTSRAVGRLSKRFATGPKSRALRIEPLEPRVVLDGTSLAVPLDPTLDQFGDQIPTVQAISARMATLATRVDADTAILSLGSAHGITTADTVDLYWQGGRRNGVTVTAYDLTSIGVDAGSGDDFPAQGTQITCGSSSLGANAFVDFSIFDTGASVVTFSADFQALAEYLGDPIPIKAPGGAKAEGIGGWITGDVSQPGTILAGGMDAMTLTFDQNGFPVLDINLGTSGAAMPGVQAFVGTPDGSPGLVTITGTPFLNPSPANPSGLAASIDMRGYLMDFSDLIPGLILPMPDIRFVAPGTAPIPTTETTAAVYVPLSNTLGVDNHLNPGDTITESYSPLQGDVQLANLAAGKTLARQNFLFDTGAQLSVISPAAAAALGLDLTSPAWTIDVSGVGGTVNVPGFVLSQLVLPTTDGGQVTFTDVPVHVLEIGYGIDGILGMNLFNTAASLVYDPFHPAGARLGLTFYTDPDRGLGELDPATLQMLESLGLTFAAATVGHRLPDFHFDTQSPSVVSIDRTGSSPTNAGAVQFAVTFSEAVAGVDAGDFALALSGTAGTIDSVVGGGTSYTVTVINVAGNGTLGLNLEDNDTVNDLSGNTLGGPGAANGNFTGQSYAIDRTGPVAALAFPAQGGTVLDPAYYASPYIDVTFSDTGSGLDASSVLDAAPEISLGGAAAGVTIQGTPQSMGGNTYRYALTGALAPGLVQVNLPAGAVADNLGNTNAAGGMSFTAAAGIAIGDATVVEGNSGSVSAVFNITLSLPSSQAVSVRYATANGSASSTGDYTAKSGTLTFSPGQTSLKLAVAVRGDTKLENNETFVVNLSNAIGAVLADTQGRGTILNDEAPSLTIADVRLVEGNSGAAAAGFAVKLSHPTTRTVSVRYATANGTATSGADYTAASGVLTVPPQQTGGVVSVSVNGDQRCEANETFFVNLTSPTAATIADKQAVGTILNDDPPAARAVPYRQDFAAGLPNGDLGWEYYSTGEGRIAVAKGQLRMDDKTNNSVNSLNEAVVHVNLAGKTGVSLQLDHVSSGDEVQTFAGAQFTGHVNADLIALSVDGTHWVKITDLSTNFTQKAFALDALLATAATAAGSSDRSDVRIKLQQYDNQPWSTDGRAFDNISVTAAQTAQTSRLSAAAPARAASSYQSNRLTQAGLASIIDAVLAQWASDDNSALRRLHRQHR